jgi:hypothetical protein
MSPNTENGKQIAKWNATRHGINSSAPVVPGLERAEDWQAHGELVLESLQPEGHLETVLAERVALLSWRLHRVTRYETGAIANAREKIEDDIDSRNHLLRRSIAETTHPIDIRHEARWTKQNERALKRFRSQQRGKVLKGQEATSVIFGVYIAARKKTGEEIDVEALDLPGVPEDAAIEELPDMKVENIGACIEAIAAHVGLDPDSLLETAIYEAGCDARGAAMKKERTEQEIIRKERERILPDDETLQKIARYEAHLSRQLYHALHELEALQTRRLGGKAPLARLDVQGITQT